MLESSPSIVGIAQLEFRLVRDLLMLVRRELISLCIISSTLIAGAARADWGVTRWGMTSAELIARVPEISPLDCQSWVFGDWEVCFVAPYDLNGDLLDAFFLFDVGQLQAVLVEGNTLEECASLEIELASQRGNPTEIESDHPASPDLAWHGDNTEDSVYVYPLSLRRGAESICSFVFARK